MPGRVLVVDDVLPNVKLLEAKLGAEYFDVLTAMDGKQAVEVAKAEKPDLILLDVMMPVMDGYEACELIKHDPETQHIPVVMVTALSDVSDRVRGLEAGADDFLTKPVDDVSLFARVRSFIRLKMIVDEWRLREQTSDNLGLGGQGPAMMTDVDTTGAKILVVEDNKIDTVNLNDILSQDDHDLTFIGDGEQALKEGTKGRYDLIIISLGLRDYDPLRLVSHLRADNRTRQAQILMVSEDDEMKRVAKALDIGINDYIVRPVDQNELLARVRAQVRRRRYQDRLRDNYERNLALALTDDLTGLYNRRYLEGHLGSIMIRVREERARVSILMLDLDFFKEVNDTYGHAVGDIVLRTVAQRIQHSVRNFDLVARFGGEEFVVLMPEASKDIAMMVAERLRSKISSEPFDIGSDRQVQLSASIGVSEISDTDTPDQALNRADEAMYVAKKNGRNQIHFAE